MPTKIAGNLRQENPPPGTLRRLGRREWIYVLCGWLMASAALMAIDQARFLASTDRILRYQEGDYIEEDYVLTDDVTFIDAGATAKLVSLNRSLSNAVYIVNGDISSKALDRYDRFASFFSSAAADPESETAARRIREEFPGPAGLIDKGNFRNTEEITALLQVTRDILEDVQFTGIFRIDSEAGRTASDIVEVVYSEESPGRRATLIRDTVYRPESLDNQIRSMDTLNQLPPEDRGAAAALAAFFSEPNAFYSHTLTAENMKQAETATSPISISIKAGTRLLSAGGTVTPRQALILAALGEQRGGGTRSVFFPLLYMAAVFGMGIVAFRTFGLSLTGNPKSMRLYAALSGVYIFIAGIVTAFTPLPPSLNIGVILPTALFTLLLAQLLQDRRMAVLSSILMALIVYFLTSGGGHELIITLAAGIGGAVAVKRRETRMGLLRAGPRLALIMAGATFLSGPLFGVPMNSLLILVAAAGNGLVTGILSLAFLPLLEHMLNTATTFRLIELSDQNVPLLRRMRLQAPGTYIHSQNVAHLAEAACDAIGADGLLARVGAYYHDIGKVDQPHFFVENQAGENKHDEMKPALSAAVIKSHVKIGIEKGRRLRLPDEVLSVIEQHHGTSVIQYFYDRALKENGGDSANRGDFSYGGPKPRSREAAVVMLADTAEAVARTLKKPTAGKLEKHILDLIMDRFRDGELNESSLTLQDLEAIKDAFVQVLAGQFHSRIEYPKEEDGRA